MRGPGCYSQPVIRKFRGTFDGSGNVTAVAGECDAGISFGAFSSGAATVTLSPRPKKACLLNGGSYDNAADRLTMRQTSAYDSSAGTLAVNMRADDDGATDTAANGEVFECFFLLDEGSA